MADGRLAVREETRSRGLRGETAQAVGPPRVRAVREEQGVTMTRSKSVRIMGRTAVVAVTLVLAISAAPRTAAAYDTHEDRLNCPRGTTLLRIESNPRACQPQPKRGIPATRGRRACCSIDRDPTKMRCLPFPQCSVRSPD